MFNSCNVCIENGLDQLFVNREIDIIYIVTISMIQTTFEGRPVY